MESAEVVLPWFGSGLTCQGRRERHYTGRAQIDMCLLFDLKLNS